MKKKLTTYLPKKVIERHKLLLPRVKDTQVKSEVKDIALIADLFGHLNIDLQSFE